MYYSSAQHGLFLLFPYRSHYVALLESLLGMHSKNRCNSDRHDILEEQIPIVFGRSFRFDLQLRMPQLGASFDRERSRSKLAGLSSRRMTTIHPIRVSLLLRLLSQVRGVFHSGLAVGLLFFIHLLTVLRATPNVLFIPLKLLRSS